MVDALGERGRPARISSVAACLGRPAGLGLCRALTGARGVRKLPRAARLMLALIAEARLRGLEITENPLVDPVDHGHAWGSAHYRTYPRTRIGKAIDVYGSPVALRSFFLWAVGHTGDGLDDAFYDPIGWSLDGGELWPVIVGGHRDHVHLSTR